MTDEQRFMHLIEQALELESEVFAKKIRILKIPTLYDYMQAYFGKKPLDDVIENIKAKLNEK